MNIKTRIAHNPTTKRFARTHATPAEYAKWLELHEPDFEGDVWHWLALAVSIVAILAVIAKLTFEWMRQQ